MIVIFKFRFSRKYSGSTGILPHQSPTRCPFPATQPREMRAVVVADAVAAVDDGDGVAVVVAFELLRGMQVAVAVVVAFEQPQAMPQLAAAAVVVAGDVVVVASEQPPKKQQLVAADAVAVVAAAPPPSLLPSR